MIFFLMLTVWFPCQHGPQCDLHTDTFGRVPGATEYRVYWGANAIGQIDADGFPFHKQPTFDVCPGHVITEYPVAPDASAEEGCAVQPYRFLTWALNVRVIEPGYCVCEIEQRRPSPGNIIYSSYVAANQFGEGSH